MSSMDMWKICKYLGIYRNEGHGRLCYFLCLTWATEWKTWCVGINSYHLSSMSSAIILCADHQLHWYLLHFHDRCMILLCNCLAMTIWWCGSKLCQTGGRWYHWILLISLSSGNGASYLIFLFACALMFDRQRYFPVGVYPVVHAVCISAEVVIFANSFVSSFHVRLKLNRMLIRAYPYLFYIY